MLILLPPSEGKAAAARGKPLDLGSLSFPALNPARQAVLDALVTLCTGDEETAIGVLGLSDGQRAEVARNARLTRLATRPAAEVYTGVVYEALDLATLPPAALARARRTIVISSGLWGLVRLGDRIPPYRCAIGVNLPGVGGLAAHWRAALPATMAEAAGTGLVLDLRSGAYASTWSPERAAAQRTVAVRVLHERTVGGVTQRSVVSHFNKATKGRLVRDLLLSGSKPRTAAELITALRDLKHTVEAPAPAPGRPWQLDLVVTDL